MLTRVQRNRTFTIRLKKELESGVYAVQCVEFPEAISQGRTERAAIANIKEAIELVLEDLEAEARKKDGRLITISI